MKSRDQGLGIGGWGLRARDSGLRAGCWGLVVYLILRVATSVANGGSPIASEGRSGPTITVRVYNYADVSRATLARAEEEASRIFREAGIEMVWLDCPTTVAESIDYPACAPPLGAMGVDLRIVPQAMASRLSLPKGALGLALPSASAGAASAAWVFSHRVLQLAQSQLASEAQILGYAIAHEIGHLLLGPGRHSSKGMMRPEWNREDLRRAAWGQLLFTAKEVSIMQDEVWARSR